MAISEGISKQWQCCKRMITRTTCSAFIEPGVMEDHQPREVYKKFMSTLNHDSRLPVRPYQDFGTRPDYIIEVRQLLCKKSPEKPLRVDVLAVKSDLYYEINIESLPPKYTVERKYTERITCAVHDVDFQVTIYPPMKISRLGIWTVLDWVPVWLMNHFLSKSGV